MKNKALIVFHRVDYDGVFSYCIARSALERNSEVITLGYTYGDPIPELSFLDYDEIYLVDISFPWEVMKSLSEDRRRFVWIDHHGTAVRDSEAHGYANVEGLRVLGTAAVELTWEYFYPDEGKPLMAEILGAYDVWNKNHPTWNWSDDIVPIQLAFRSAFGMNNQDIYSNFDPSSETLLSSDGSVRDWIERGRLIKKYEDQQFRGAVRAYGFPVTVAGGYKGIAMLTQNSGSRIFESVLGEYDIYVTVNRKYDSATGGHYYTYGLYQEPGRTNLDLGKYVRETYGQDFGGHPGACGGRSSSVDMFLRLIEGGEI